MENIKKGPAAEVGIQSAQGVQAGDHGTQINIFVGPQSPGKTSFDYDLARLGPREFEQLTLALCTAALGAKAQAFGKGSDGDRDATPARPRLQAFRDEPDGGRDATMVGQIDWSKAGDGDGPGHWSGYTVVLAKFNPRPGEPSSNLQWLQKELAKDLHSWDAKLRRSAAASLSIEEPENMLIVTNVMVPHPAGEGVANADESIAGMLNHSELDLENWRLWDYGALSRLLDAHSPVRLAYGGFLARGDILSRMDQWLERDKTKLDGVLTTHAIKDMRAQQYVKLGQAGDPNEDKLALYQIGVDLPAQVAVFEKTGRSVRDLSAARYIIDQGNRVIDLTAQTGPPHLLLIGGPGQGKSTLTQLVCQCYRVALLRDAQLGQEAQRLIGQLSDHFASIDLTLPSHRRWPIRVVLSEYGDYVATNKNSSLMRYLADKVSLVSSSDVTGEDIKEWLGSWPWL